MLVQSVTCAVPLSTCHAAPIHRAAQTSLSRGLADPEGPRPMLASGGCTVSGLLTQKAIAPYTRACAPCWPDVRWRHPHCTCIGSEYMQSHVGF